jgi:hypothetical protein
LRTSAAFDGSLLSRHARNASAAAFCLSAPRPGSSTSIGAPRNSSIGCDRNSTVLTPSDAVFAITSSTGIVR